MLGLVRKWGAGGGAVETSGGPHRGRSPVFRAALARFCADPAPWGHLGSGAVPWGPCQPPAVPTAAPPAGLAAGMGDAGRGWGLAICSGLTLEQRPLAMESLGLRAPH